MAQRSMCPLLVGLCLGFAQLQLSTANGDSPSEYTVSIAKNFEDFNFMYTFVTTPATKKDAVLFCHQMNMRLLAIDVNYEQKVLVKYLDEGKYKGINFLTSGSDKSDKGNWYWTTAGKHISVDYWVSKPTEALDDGGTRRCLMMDASEGYNWNDVDCEEKNAFICEREIR